VHQGTTLTSVEIPQNGRVPCYFLNGLKSDLEGLEYDWICLTSASGLGRHRLGRLCHRRPDDGLAGVHLWGHPASMQGGDTEAITSQDDDRSLCTSQPRHGSAQAKHASASTWDNYSYVYVGHLRPARHYTKHMHAYAGCSCVDGCLERSGVQSGKVALWAADSLLRIRGGVKTGGKFP